MTRSRLRKPTSKSIATVFFPCIAMPVAMFALVVVLPTPPLPEATTTTLDAFDTVASLMLLTESIQRAIGPVSKFFTVVSDGIRRFRGGPARHGRAAPPE